MRLLSRMLLIAIAAAGVGMTTQRADASHFTARIYDQDRYLWDLYSYWWYLNDGTRDAYDAFARSSINGQAYRPTANPYKYFEYSNRGIRSANNPRIGCFEVQTRMWVPPNGNVNSRNYARLIWNIRNRCGSTQNLNFRIYGNLGSDGATRITNSSDGDTNFETTDHWLATDDSSNGGGDPSLAFVFGNGTARQPSSVRRSGDNLYFDWNGVRIPANQTKTFMFFTIQDRNRAASFAEARRVVTLPSEVMTNLTAAERRQLVNFGLGAAVRNLAVTVFDNNVPAIRATWELSERTTARAQLFENSRIPNGQTACSGENVVATSNMAANTRFTFTWANRANWNVLKRGTSYCVKVTATDGNNKNTSRAVTLNSAIGSVTSSIDQYAPSISATVRFNANPGAATYVDLYPTSNCSGTRTHRYTASWNGRSISPRYTGNLVRRNTSYCIKVINGYASRNFAIGTVTTEPRSYPDSLTHILGRLRAIDGGGEDFEDDLNDAISHISTAKAYWLARTEAGNNTDFNAVQMNWGPSLRRAVSAIRSMASARRNDAPRALRTHEANLAAAMRQEVKVFVRGPISARAAAEGAPGYWTAIRNLASTAVDSAADQAAGQPKAVASANAYDKLAAMYDSRYSAENRISAAQIALDAAIDDDVGDRPLDELTAALNAGVRYGLKLEIKLARDTNAAGRAQLDLVLRSISTVAGCLAGLQSNSLNDHDFTACYQEVIIILKKLSEVQGALVDTATWRGLLGVGVYAMLDISIYHTPNSLVTREGVPEDAEAQEGIAQYRAGLAEVRGGNMKTAIQRYINNECRIINLYNRYWAGPGNAVIDNTDACARVCGNSQVEEGEQCDDGNFTDTDGCTRTCQRNVCGDGSLYRGREACDDGNRVNTDGCTNLCTVARCGDSVVRAGSEECDDGNRVNDDNCSNECVAARCGDSIRQGAEECDDGDQNNTNTCSNTCRLNAAKIAAGYYHTCFLRGGNVYCSGYNGLGQLGDGSQSQRTSAVQVRNLSNVKSVSAGLYHSCAVKNDGTAWCWGWGPYGQLGNGSTANRTTPIQVRGLTGITQISAGYLHTCARKSDGTLYCWGYNGYGQLGNGNTNPALSPVQVRGISNGKSIVGGLFHTCATLTSGAVKCWGYGQYHQTTNTSSRPTATTTPRTISGLSGINTVASHAYGLCALRNSGTVHCWGYGCHGQMGDGRRSCYNYGNRTVSGLSNVAELGGGYFHMCARLTNGTVKCWGYNGYGNLGDGTTTQRTSPVAVRGITNAVGISHGTVNWHSCAARSDSSVACWGNNNYGQLGNASTSRSTIPVNVVGVAGGDVGLGNAANNPGRSCKNIKTVRAAASQSARSGTYHIDPNGGSSSDSVRVYCDMTTDGGGWTQVANTRNYTLNDQGGGYYSDIASKVPTGQHYSIWNGMRSYVSGNTDIRFTCKLNKDSASHNVDMSFYNIHWYREITTGSDAQSCFEETNGRGYTRPAPARKNNLNNQSLARGNNWNYGYLEGEDYCGDTGDFTIDFDNRGMDSNQTDGTDWGEDDSAKKCGSSYGGSNASWQIWVRERAVNGGGGGGGGGGNGSCGGWSWNSGCWYTAARVGMTCNQVCSSRGGFNAGRTRHSGNQVGRHFWPRKASGRNWVGIECSSTDNNTNWGANGSTPNGNWRHGACYVNCACNR